MCAPALIEGDTGGQERPRLGFGRRDADAEDTVVDAVEAPRADAAVHLTRAEAG